MGYSTDFTITVDPDDGSDGKKLIEILDKRLGEYWGMSGPVSYHGGISSNGELQVSGKFYDMEKAMILETVGLPAWFDVTGVGEEPYIPVSYDGSVHVDIWRQFFRDGTASKKHTAVVTLPSEPEFEGHPVAPLVTERELRSMALTGDEAALETLLAMRE